MQAIFQYRDCSPGIAKQLTDGTTYHVEVEANTQAGRWSASKKTDGVTTGKSSVKLKPDDTETTSFMFNAISVIDDENPGKKDAIAAGMHIPPGAADGDTNVVVGRDDTKGEALASQATTQYKFGDYSFDFGVQSSSGDRDKFPFKKPVEMCLDCTNANFDAGQAPVLRAFDEKYGVWYNIADSCEEPRAYALNGQMCVTICSFENPNPPPPCDQLDMPASKQACDKRYDCESRSGGNACVAKPSSQLRRVLDSDDDDENLFAVFTQDEPIARLSVQTKFANVPEQISMHARDSYDPNNDSITFNFTANNTETPVPKSTLGNPDHAVVSITKGGIYEFCVTVQDTNYAQVKECKAVHVNEPPVIDGWLGTSEDGRVHHDNLKLPLELAVAVHDPDDTDWRNIALTWGQSQKGKSEGVLTFSDATVATVDPNSNCKEQPACNQATAVASVKIAGMRRGLYWVNITLEDDHGGFHESTIELSTTGYKIHVYVFM